MNDVVRSLHSPLPVALEDVIRQFPTLGASNPHFSRSERYAHVSTRDILAGLYDEGFRVHSVQTARVRPANQHKLGFEKHLIRLRQRDAIIVNGASPEVIVTNSHDGSSGFSVMGGLIRFACENGLVIGDLIQRVAIRHTGDISERVVDATHAIARQVSDVLPVIDAMRALPLSNEARETFAEKAHAIRFAAVDAETGETRAPITPLALLTARRSEDTGRDLWSTFNVVQENMTKGGLQGRIVGSNGRMRRASMRAINGIEGTIDVNRRLFNLATDTYRDLVAA